MPLHAPAFTLLFLPFLLLLYALVRRWWPGWSAAALLGASLIFYAIGDPTHLPLLLAFAAVNYGLGRSLAATGTQHARKLLLAAGVVLNLAVLAAAKYGFVPGAGANLDSEAADLTQAAMPLGLSFFILQQITWLAESWRRADPSLGPIRFGLYAMFFPQMVAGPILRYPQAAEQYAALGDARIDPIEVARGLSLLVVGLAKKLLIADPIGRVADPLFDAVAAGHVPTFLEGWTAGWAYLLQLYFDFSGLSDIAIGIGLMVGLRLPINFNSPLKARGASDCFDRWHMSLTMFVRIYLFAPLFGWLRRHAPGRATRRTLLAWGAATIVSLSLVGWWHGPRATFLLSGFLIGVAAVVLQLRAVAFPRAGGRPARRSFLAERLPVVVGLLLFGIFFRAADLPAAGRLLAALGQPWHISVGTSFALLLPEALRDRVAAGGFFPGTGLPSQFGLVMLALASLIVFLAPNTLQIFGLWHHPGAPAPGQEKVRLAWRPSLGWALCLALLLAASVIASVGGDSRAALYARY